MKYVILGYKGFFGRAVWDAIPVTDVKYGVDSKGCVIESRGGRVTALGSLALGPLAEEVFRKSIVIDLAWSGIPVLSLSNGLESVISINRVFDCLSPYSRPDKWIGIGSCFEYSPSIGATGEDTLVARASEFQIAKHIAFEVSRKRCKDLNVRFAWVRPFYLFGEGQPSKSLLPMIIDSLNSGRIPCLNHIDNYIDMISVLDAAKLLIALSATTWVYEIFNLGSGRPTFVREVLHKACIENKLEPEFFEIFGLNAAIPQACFWADMSRWDSVEGYADFRFEKPIEFLFQRLDATKNCKKNH